MSAATVAAVATVAGAGVAAYGAYNQHKQSKANAEGLYGSKVVPPPFKNTVGTEESYAQAGIHADVGSFVDQGLPQIMQMSNKVNQRANQQREKLTGGTFKETIRQEGANILGMEQGQLPADVIDSINRIVGENLGGAFDPSDPSGGFGMSRDASSAAEKLGLTSYGIMKEGMGFGSAWRTNANSFVYKPQDSAKGMYFPAGNALAASKLQMELDQNQWASEAGIARAAAMPDPQAVGALNDQSQALATGATALSNMGGALSGLYTSLNTPQAGTYQGTAAQHNLPPMNGNPYAPVYRPQRA
jgi:hypothetical protein